MATNINTILSWFRTGKKPTQAQFEQTFTSFFHKEEPIPQASISNLSTVLNGKADKVQFDGHRTDANAHYELFIGKESKSEKGIPNGYAGLDSEGRVYPSQLPSLIASTDDVIEGAVNKYSTLSLVMSYVLTGISFAIGTPITATDTILSAFGKLQKQINDFRDIPVQIDLVVTTNVTNSTNGTVGGSGSFAQHGKNVVIQNGVNNINYTINGAITVSFVKHGTGAITFVQGSGRTLVQVDGTNVFNGAVGSTATIASVGTTDYLRISNA
jgi:hypothetical protein